MCGSMDNLERLSKFLSNYKREPGSVQECCETLMKLTEKEREKDPGHGWKVIAQAATTLEDFCPELIHAIVKFPNWGYWECELPKTINHIYISTHHKGDTHMHDYSEYTDVEQEKSLLTELQTAVSARRILRPRLKDKRQN